MEPVEPDQDVRDEEVVEVVERVGSLRVADAVGPHVAEHVRRRLQAQHFDRLDPVRETLVEEQHLALGLRASDGVAMEDKIATLPVVQRRHLSEELPEPITVAGVHPSP